MALLGCIADDLTSATDLALMLAREGMRTVQVNGLPEAATPVPEADALVVALKSRTVPPSDAVAWSLAALQWLRAAGAPRLDRKSVVVGKSVAVRVALGGRSIIKKKNTHRHTDHPPT